MPFGGYKLFHGDVVVGGIPLGGSTWIKSGEGDPAPIAVAFSGETYAFVRELRILAQLRRQAKALHADPHYDLEIAQDADIDPVLIVAVSVGIDQTNRAVLTGGGF